MQLIRAIGCSYYIYIYLTFPLYRKSLNHFRALPCVCCVCILGSKLKVSMSATEEDVYVQLKLSALINLISTKLLKDGSNLQVT
jgi:hypothetical protein